MKTKLILITCIFSTCSYAQTDGPLVINKDVTPTNETMLRKNAIYFELLGNSIVYSLNYERMVYQKGKMHLAARAGIGHYFDYSPEIAFMIPAELNMLLGKTKNFFEIGLGHTYNTRAYYYVETNNYERVYFYSHYITLRLGYRYQRADKGLVFRLGILPMFNYWPGLLEDSSFNDGFRGTILSFWNSTGVKSHFAFWGGISIGKTF